jgi:hypothetical protein
MLKKNVVPSLKLPSSSGPPRKVIATARIKRVTERQSRKKLAEDTVMESLQTGSLSLIKRIASPLQILM